MSTSDPGGQRLFTLEEANAIVEQITPLLERLREEHAALMEARQTFGEYANNLRNHGFLVEGHRVESEIGEHIARLRDGIESIADLGVEIKNLEWGLVDFPALRRLYEIQSKELGRVLGRKGCSVGSGVPSEICRNDIALRVGSLL